MKESIFGYQETSLRSVRNDFSVSRKNILPDALSLPTLFLFSLSIFLKKGLESRCLSLIL